MYKISKDHLLRLTLYINIMGDTVKKSGGIINIADLTQDAKKAAWDEACRITKETCGQTRRDANYRN